MDYIFYTRPNGYHFYKRTENQETPVLSHYSGAVLHTGKVGKAEEDYEEVEPTQEMKEALGAIQAQAEALREHGEESGQYQIAASKFNELVEELDYKERSVVLTVMEHVSQAENYTPEQDIIQDLLEYGEEPTVETQEEETEGEDDGPKTVDIG